MAIITIPGPHHKEVRCDGFIGRNNLDAELPLPTDTVEARIAKIVAKYRLSLDRQAEPQKADGSRDGERERLPEAVIDLAASLGTTYTRADGVTFTGLDFLLSLEAVVDAHKADGLTMT